MASEQVGNNINISEMVANYNTPPEKMRHVQEKLCLKI